MNKDNFLIIEKEPSESKWIALDFNDNMISEGKTPQEATSLAKTITTGNFFLMFVPKAGLHIFSNYDRYKTIQ